MEAWVECCATDIEMLLPRNLIEGGSYKGHEGIRRALADAFETLGSTFASTCTASEQPTIESSSLGRATNVGSRRGPYG